jgi:hypothetical protein
MAMDATDAPDGAAGDVAFRRLAPGTLSAGFTPQTFRADDAGATVEVMVSTGAPNPLRDPVTGMRFAETLVVTPEAVRLARLNAGAPVLIDHRNAVDAIVGVVERAWISGGELRAALRFATSERAQAVAGLVRDGVLRNVSCGYVRWRAQAMEPRRPDDAGELRVTDWEPMEVSFVAVPVEAGAGVRAAGEMPETEILFTRASEAAARNPEVQMDPTENPGAPAAPEPQTAPTVDVEAIRMAERARCADIWTRAAALGLHDLGQQLINDGVTLEAAALRFVDAMQQRTGNPPAPAAPRIEVRHSHEDPAQILDAMGDALAVRSMPNFKAGSDRFREYVGLRPTDMLIELARARGQRVGPRDRMALIERAFHTTSDVPLLLANAGNKMLEAGYRAATPSYKEVFARRRFNDFKAHSFLTVGDFPTLQTLEESAEIQAGTVSEKREQVTLKTYARQVRVTRQLLVNDDLGAFTDFAAMIGRRVADFENTTAYALMMTAGGDGPTLATGSAAVFGTGTSRANKAGTGGAISETTLDAGHAAMMAQTSIDGIRLNLTPAILLTGTAYRGTALRYTTRISPESGANVGLYSNLRPVADANVTGNRWYLFANPSDAPVYVYGYLNDNETPMIRTDTPMGVDAVVVEVKHDFAVGAVDHRGGYFNAGA